MTQYSTEFPISNDVSVRDVLGVAKEWVRSSPHTTIPAHRLGGPIVDGEELIQEGTESVHTLLVVEVDREIGGLRRIERAANGLIWTTSIVSLKTTTEHLLSIQVVCEASTTATVLPRPRKPYFIKLAMERLKGGKDGEIPITDRPFELSDGQETVAAALIAGTARNRLPIVYVSAGFDGDYAVRPHKIAQFVSGLAHVVVEPSREFSLRLRDLVGAKNVYGGTVGVYWPLSDAKRSFFLDPRRPSVEALEIAIAQDLEAALANRRLTTACSWNSLLEARSRSLLEKLKDAGSNEVSAYVAAFDRDIAAKQARIDELESKLAALEAQQSLQPNFRHGGGGLLRNGREQDYCDGEIADVLIEALKRSLQSALENSRSAHIIEDIIAANPTTGHIEAKAKELKQVLRDYRSMDKPTRSALARLGFDVSEEGKHIKITYFGDERYKFTLPKSGSDHRGGLNTVSDISKIVF